MIILTDSIAHTFQVGESLGECLVGGRQFDKSEFSLWSLLPASSPGTQAFRLPAAPPRWPLQRPPFMPRVQSGPFTRVPWASRPQPPPAPRHWSHLLPVRPLVLPTAALPSSKLRLGSFPTAGTLQQLLIGPACQPLLLIGGRFPHGRGCSLPQRTPIGHCCARVGGAFQAGPPLFLLRPKPRDGPGSR